MKDFLGYAARRVELLLRLRQILTYSVCEVLQGVSLLIILVRALRGSQPLSTLRILIGPFASLERVVHVYFLGGKTPVLGERRRLEFRLLPERLNEHLDDLRAIFYHVFLLVLLHSLAVQLVSLCYRYVVVCEIGHDLLLCHRVVRSVH